MHHRSQGEDAIVRLLTEQYGRIRPLEEAWGIRFSPEDLRPRIEHFHDAVRAYTAQEARAYEKGGRLTVEHLAYDLAQLRIIQEKPAGALHQATARPPAGSLVPQGEASRPRAPDQKTRMELAALYTYYTLLFAALFAERAEDDFRIRSEQAESQMEDLAHIEQVLAALTKGRMNAHEAEEAFMHVERDDLREAMQAMTRKGKFSPADMMKAGSITTTIRKGLANEKETVAKAHLSYATGQLAVYEAGKDAVKKLAGQGLNLAGAFLEKATQGAGQARGR